MKSETKNRNQFVDMMRGIAMLMVVLGHTMTGCTSDAQDSFLFNIVWSLQMPLFILISGYITKYSHKIVDWSDFIWYLQRRTVAYMLPWATWSFIIRGFIFGEHNFFDIKYILWNMDSGYWFLATIWTISVIFGVASYIAKCVVKEDGIKQQFVVLTVYICGMFALFGMGVVFGLSFFAIKLTLYYMPFYFAGYLFGQYDDRLLSSPIGRKFADCMIGLCAVWWIYILLRYSLYDLNDSGWNIILRAGTSLAGCVTICGLLQEIALKGKFYPTVCLLRKEFTGNLSHALSDVGSGEACILAYIPTVSSVTGIILVSMNYLATLTLSILAIQMIGCNPVLKKIAFGK